MSRIIRYWKMMVTLILIGCLLFVPADSYAAKVKVSRSQKAVRAYRSFVKSKKYKKYTKTVKNARVMVSLTGKNLYNGLPDINKDGVPELIIWNMKTGTYSIFRYSADRVCFVKTLRGGTSDNDMIGIHKKSRKIFVTETLDQNVGDVMSSLLLQGEINVNDLSQKLMKQLTSQMKEKVYQVNKSADNLKSIKKRTMSISFYRDGAYVFVNGRKRIDMQILLNEKSLSKVNLYDENLVLHTMAVKYTDISRKKEFRVAFSFQGMTLRDFNRLSQQMESGDQSIAIAAQQKMMKIMMPTFYEGSRKISEERLQSNMAAMIGIFDSFVSLNPKDYDSYIGCTMKQSLQYLQPRTEKMKLSFSRLNMKKGATAQIRISTMVPYDANKEYVAVSDNESIATVSDSGKIKAKQPGRTKIRVGNLYNEDIICVINVTVRK